MGKAIRNIHDCIKMKINIKMKKSFSVLLFVAVLPCVMLLTFGLSAFAQSNLPTGDMKYRPKVEDMGEIELNSEEGNSLTPAIVNANLSTGPHYQCLSDDEKTLYEAIYGAVSNGIYVSYKDLANIRNESVYKSKAYKFYTGTRSFFSQYSGSGASNAINRAAQAVCYDNADHIEFYMVFPNQYSYTVNNDGTVDTYIVLAAHMDESQFATCNSQIQNSLNSIVTKIKEDAKAQGNDNWPAVMELVAHDYYCTTYGIDYDYANLDLSGNAAYFDFAHTAYGSLVEKSAVCDGYSSGFKLIMEKIGVDVMTVTGVGGSASSMGGHAWNIIELDGNWYELDTTWDDNDGRSVTGVENVIMHEYFNRTTSEFSSSLNGGIHNRVENSGYFGFRLPTATGAHWTYDYLVKNVSYEHDPYSGCSIHIQNSLTLKVGEKGTVSVTVDPENTAYTLTSSDTSVAQVSGTTVEGISEGIAIITATCTEHPAVSASCAVTVEKVAVTGITIPESLELSIDGTAEITATITPDDATDKDYTLESSDPGIVMVDGKTVKGVSVGTATVTASTADGELSATCKVTVSIPQGYRFTQSGNTYFTIGKDSVAIAGSTKSTVTIPATVTFGGMTYKVTSVAQKAFYKNPKITTIKGGGNLTTIGSSAFSECFKLKKVKLYEATKLKSIGSKAFYKSRKVATLEFNVGKLKTVGSKAFGKISSKAKFTLKASSNKKYNKAVKLLKKGGAKKATYNKKKK